MKRHLRLISIMLILTFAMLLIPNMVSGMGLPGLVVTAGCADFSYTAFTIDANRDNTGMNTEAYSITVTDGQGTVLHFVQNLGGLPIGVYFEGAAANVPYNQGATPLDNVRIYTWLSLAGNGFLQQTAYTVTNPDCTTGQPDVTLVANAACNGANLEVNITAGDGPFNITGTGPGLPANGVAVGTTVLTGPGAWTGVTVTETGGDGEVLNLGAFNCAAPTVALAANAACNGANLEVNITAGDGPFDITGTGPGLPANGVAAGTTVLTGPGAWTGVTVIETGGDGESLILGDFNCALIVGPGYGSNPAPGATINFGQVVPGNSRNRALIVNETGTAQLDVDLDGGSIATAITGPNAADFTIISPAFPFSIADGGPNQTITLQCTPGALGVRTATLTLTTNDPAFPTVSYPLTCRGVRVVTDDGDHHAGGNGGGQTTTTQAPPPPPCADISGSTNAIVSASVPAGTVTNGNVYCRVINENGRFIFDPAEIGDVNVINQGVRQAVDVFGLYYVTGLPAPRFNNPITICLQGVGSLVYFDATAAPRTSQTIAVSTQGSYTCGTIPNAGTVVLTGAAPVMAQQPAATSATETALNGCRVTTLYALRLRAEPNPNSAIVAQLPYDITLDALARSGGWYRVIYQNGQGWVDGAYLTKTAACGS